MYAPLLLHPVDMERKLVKGKYRYSIGSLGEETEVNLTLSERLHQDFRRRLPVFKDEDTPEEYFRNVAEAIDGMRGWRVRRFVVLGHFSFARLAMFHDLEDSNWPAEVGIIGNPVISELFAGADAGTGAFFADEYEVDDPTIAVKVPLLITDADSSQFGAIVDVMDGKNLAIKGPPGTGKSQTITNIIAAALAREKSVLFVAEKMAALNVVKDRLEKAELGQFCLELHSTKARKKELLKALDQRLKKQSRFEGAEDLALAIIELERNRDQLGEYVSAINRKFGASGETIHQILWSEQRTRSDRDGLPKMLEKVELAGAHNLTRHDLANLRSKLEALASAYADVASSRKLEEHPWFTIGNTRLDYFGRESLISSLGACRDALNHLQSLLAELGQTVGYKFTATVESAEKVAETLARLPEPTTDLSIAELYPKLVDTSIGAVLTAFLEDQADWLNAGRRLAELGLEPAEAVKGEGELRKLALLAAEIVANGSPVGLEEAVGFLEADTMSLRASRCLYRPTGRGFRYLRSNNAGDRAEAARCRRTRRNFSTRMHRFPSRATGSGRGPRGASPRA